MGIISGYLTVGVPGHTGGIGFLVEEFSSSDIIDH